MTSINKEESMMKEQSPPPPLVSVIIPVYNGRRHLPGCIDSIVCQSLSHFEAIFVDDGSADDSLQFLNERASLDSRIKVIHQKNRGVTQARRNGVKQASGKYICFVDCDDKLPPDALNVLHNKALLNDADIVCGNSSYADRIKSDYSLDSIHYVTTLLEQKSDLVVWAKLYKKSLLTDYAFDIPAHIKFAEDYIMNIRIGFKAKKVFFIHDFVYQYSEYNEGSVTSTFQLSAVYVKEVCEYVLEEVHKANAESTLYRSTLIFLKYMIWMMIHHNVLDMDNAWVNTTIKRVTPILSYHERCYLKIRKLPFFSLIQKMKQLWIRE